MDILRWTGSGSFDAEVVGESYYQTDLKRIAGDEKRKRVVARLICETDNPHDKNAVRVEISGKTVGHLSRGLAPVHRRKLAEMKRGGAVVECEAVAVTGKDGVVGVYLDLPVDDEDEPIAIAPAQKARPRLSKRQSLWLAVFAITGILCCCLAAFPKK